MCTYVPIWFKNQPYVPYVPMWSKKIRTLCSLSAYVVQIHPYVPYVPMWFKKKSLCTPCVYVVQIHSYVPYLPMWFKKSTLCSLSAYVVQKLCVAFNRLPHPFIIFAPAFYDKFHPHIPIGHRCISRRRIELTHF